MRLELHSVGANDPDHPLHVGLPKVGEVGGLPQQQYHLRADHINIKIQNKANQGCQMAKFDPFLSLDCGRVEGAGAQSKDRKGSNFAAKRSGAIVHKPEGPNK